MSFRPWMTRRFLAALLTMTVLFVLLVAASLRLLARENELVDYITEDMVWLSSQAQYEAMRFADALGSFRQGLLTLPDVQLRLDLLSSRIAIMENGEPYRQLQAFGHAEDIDNFRLAVDWAHERLQSLEANEVSMIAALHGETIDLASSLRTIANAALLNKRNREAFIRQQRRITLFQVLGTLVATMLASLVLARIVIRDHRNMVTAESALEREREVSRLQRAFTSVVSHQFRTPLAIIDASAQRMIRRGGQMTIEEITSRADKIRAACLRLTRLMESTLNAARLEEGEIALNVRSCDVAKLLRDVVDSQPEHDQRRIELRTETLPVWVEADPILLEQAVQNLVSNALKYSDDSQPVLIHARRVGTEICISVIDQGVGVPADEVKSLFRRFFRARTAEGVPGTGIGLHFVAQIMDLHGGQVDVTSVEGRGSDFTLRFPIKQPAEQQRQLSGYSEGVSVP